MNPEVTLARAYHIKQILFVDALLRGAFPDALRHIRDAINLRGVVAEQYGHLDYGHWRMIQHLKETEGLLSRFVKEGRPHQFKISERLYNAVSHAVDVPTHRVVWAPRPGRHPRPRLAYRPRARAAA